MLRTLRRPSHRYASIRTVRFGIGNSSLGGRIAERARARPPDLVGSAKALRPSELPIFREQSRQVLDSGFRESPGSAPFSAGSAEVGKL